MKKLTAEWVRKAEADIAAARKLARARPPISDPACFHCQQAMEKYLKALLQEFGLAIPYTHDLDALLNLVVPHDASLNKLRRGLNILTQYAVDYRYPGIRASARRARSALRRSEKMREEFRAKLRIRPRRPRRRK